MKKSFRAYALVATLFLAAIQANAIDLTDKLYLGFDLGPSLKQDTTGKIGFTTSGTGGGGGTSGYGIYGLTSTSLGGQIIPTVTGPATRGRLVSGAGVIYVAGFNASFNPGISADASLGYKLNSEWNAELRTGVNWNSMERPFNGDFFDVPFLGCIVYKPAIKSSFKPYVGVGVGGVASIVSMGSACEADFTFAYQFMAGVRRQLGANTEIGLGYKFFGTLDHSWEDRGVVLATDNTYTHSVTAEFIWHF